MYNLESLNNVTLHLFSPQSCGPIYQQGKLKYNTKLLFLSWFSDQIWNCASRFG